MSKDSHGYISGSSRDQVCLFPSSLDEYLSSGNAVRFIDVFVESLDMESLGFVHSTPSQTGRPSYDPKVLLGLFIYGYLVSVTSSRRLEAETQRNVEVMWLLKELQPDHKTIARFRSDNAEKFPLVLKEFNSACRKLKLFSREVAIDGSKFKAVNSDDRYLKRASVEAQEARAEAKVKAYLEALAMADAADDAEETPELSKEELQQKIDYWRKQQQEAAAQQKLLDKHGMDELAVSDTDSIRLTDRKHRRGVVGYNVQIAVDTTSHLIADVTAVTSKNDLNQLGEMSIRTQAALDIDPADTQGLTVLADAGYHQANQLEVCEDRNITAIVPAPRTGSGRTNDGREVFARERFSYDKESDSYRCPNGAELPRKGSSEENGIVTAVYYASAACSQCPLKSQCTTSEFRRLKRRDKEEVVERAALRYQENRERFRKRKSTVEHVFGTLRNRGQDTFLQRGKKKILAELHLSALAYNITRAINLVGNLALMQAVGA